MNSYDFQRAVLAAARERAQQPDHWINELATVLHKSKFTIYKKLRGELLLSVEELIVLKEHYQIDLDPLITSKGAFGAILVNTGFELMATLRNIRDQLTAWIQMPQVHIELNSSFFFHLCRFPRLALFYLVVHTGMEEDILYLPDDSPIKAKALSIARQINHLYNSLESREHWHRQLFQDLEQRLHERISQAQYPEQTSEELLHGFDELLAYVNTLQERGSKPVAQIDVPNSRVVLTYSAQTDDMPICVVHSSEQDYLYCGNWVGMTTQTKNQVLVDVAIEKFNLMAESEGACGAEAQLLANVLQ